MARLLLCMLLALTVVLSGDAVGVRAKAKVGAGPVQKVLQLIDDFTAKVKLAAEEDTKVFQEFAQLCDEEVSTTEYAIKGTKEQIVELQATIGAGNAVVETETSKIADVTSMISAKEKELSEAVSMRKNEHSDFVAAEKELMDTVDSLAGAQMTLKKSLALLQANGDHFRDSDRKAVEIVSGSLAQIAEAAFVTTQQRAQIQEFFQMKEDAQDDLSFSMLANSKAKDSGAILDTLAEMEEKASDTLTKTRNDEMEAASAAALMKQGLENEIKSLKTEMAQSTQKRQAAVESTAQATSDLAVEEKSLSSDSKSLRDAKHECQDKAKEYEVQARDTNAELTALTKAKAILSKKFAGASFVEIRSTTHMRSHAKAHDAAGVPEHRAEALRMIEQLGKKYQSTALVALAYRAAADPFVKIRGMIEEMIEKLLQKAAEEASQKSFCDKEMGESKKQQATKVGKIDKLSARVGEAEAKVAKLMEETARLSEELADLDKNLAKATKIRNEEHAVFLESEKELSESEEACSAAISVLREYYEGAAFVQVASRTRRATAGTVEEEGDGSGILGILEVAESDFATSLAEVRQGEAASVDEFNTLLQDSKVQKASMSMDFKGKQTELKNLKVTISENTEDKAGLSEELDAVNAYLDKLRPQCETKAPSYAEVKAKREAEIQGLKEALDVLSGNGVPTGFLQKTAATVW